jgi:hypothetical protein
MFILNDIKTMKSIKIDLIIQISNFIINNTVTI